MTGEDALKYEQKCVACKQMLLNLRKEDCVERTQKGKIYFSGQFLRQNKLEQNVCRNLLETNFNTLAACGSDEMKKIFCFKYFDESFIFHCLVSTLN